MRTEKAEGRGRLLWACVPPTSTVECPGSCAVDDRVGRRHGARRQSMALMTETERAFARGLSDLFLANPFLPDWVTAQRKVLGPEFVTAPPVWHAHPDPLDRNPNIAALNARIEAFATRLRERLVNGTDPGPDAELYQDLSTYLLFAYLEPELKQLMAGPEGVTTWPGFARFV